MSFAVVREKLSAVSPAFSNTASGHGIDASLLTGISIVVPVYNSQATLRELAARLQPILDTLTAHYEVIFVNDGSKDASWDVIEELTQHNAWIRGVNLMRNYGQHNALLCGIRMAQYPITVTIDDDLQHPPEQLPKLLAKLEEGYDVVYGTPQQEQHGFLRNLASRMTKTVLQNAMGAEIAQNLSALRAIRTQVRDSFGDYRSLFVSIDVLLTWGTTRFGAIPIPHEPRQNGTSNYTLKKLLTHSLNMLTGFSVLPLQIASIIGFCFTLFGMGVLGYVVLRYLIQGGSVPGFSFLASIIAIFSGAQLFALGIIGEYLARMHFRMMERPAYTIRTITQKANGHEVVGSLGNTVLPDDPITQ